MPYENVNYGAFYLVTAAWWMMQQKKKPLKLLPVTFQIFFDDAVNFACGSQPWGGKKEYTIYRTAYIRALNYSSVVSDPASKWSASPGTQWGREHPVQLQAMVTFSTDGTLENYINSPHQADPSLKQPTIPTSPRPYGMATMRGLLRCRDGNKTVMVVKKKLGWERINVE